MKLIPLRHLLCTKRQQRWEPQTASISCFPGVSHSWEHTLRHPLRVHSQIYPSYYQEACACFPSWKVSIFVDVLGLSLGSAFVIFLFYCAHLIFGIRYSQPPSTESYDKNSFPSVPPSASSASFQALLKSHLPYNFFQILQATRTSLLSGPLTHLIYVLSWHLNFLFKLCMHLA